MRFCVSGSRAGVHMLLAVWDPAGSLPKAEPCLGWKRGKTASVGSPVPLVFINSGGAFNNMDQGWLKKKLNISPLSQSGVNTFENWMQCLP